MKMMITGLQGIARRLEADGLHDAASEVGSRKVKQTVVVELQRHDPRTIRSWVEAAVFFEVLAVKPTKPLDDDRRSKSKEIIYTRGPNFSKYLDRGQSQEVRP